MGKGHIAGGKLSVGDAVVHIDHGIARYVGMTQREFGGAVREYLQLDFAGTDKIFLPAEQIGRMQGVTMVVENRPGASGMIGAEAVVNAPADGYTILFTTAALAQWRKDIGAKMPTANPDQPGAPEK